MTGRRTADRLSLLRQLLREQGMTALLVTRREDVRYLTGFSGSAGVVLVGEGFRADLITDFRYSLQARAETSGITIILQKRDWISAVAETVRRRKMRSVWFEPSSLTVAVHRKLGSAGVRLRACRNDLVADLREEKDRSELLSIQKAVKRAEDAFLALRTLVRPGVRECDLALRLDFLMREAGSRRPAFDTIVASGKNGAMPHASVTNRRIRKGDLVTFDFGAEADGYFCDMTRTVCVGRPTAKQREIHDLVLRAQQNAIAAVRPGAACRAVDEAARSVIAAAGHGRDFGHSTGHGIGLMVHEGPAISPQSKAVVKERMVFTVEPGVYLPGWGGVRIEDMVYVTAGGAQVLTSLSREL